MRKIFLTIAIVVSAASSALADQNPQAKRAENILAVLDMEVVGKVDQDVARPLTDSVRREIVKADKYEVMDRGNMDKILKEQAFQMTGCTSKECAVEAGQLLGVGKIIVGSVSMVGKTYLLSLSLVNIETGKVEQVEDQECKCEVDDLIKLSKRVAGNLMGVIVTKADVPTSMAKGDSTDTVIAISKEQACRQTDGRFCDHGDGTVTDKSTGLMWQQKDDGNGWRWDDAVYYCEGLNLAGKSNWRLPTRKELLTLVDKAQGTPMINIKYFPETSASNYWTNFALRTSAFYRHFGEGYELLGDKSKGRYVRCVRR